jgi:hypothetical protein
MCYTISSFLLERVVSREVRRVPKGWQHPKSDEGEFIGLSELSGPFKEIDDEWNEGRAKWLEGYSRDYSTPLSETWVKIDPEYARLRYTDYCGRRPSPDDYMPEWGAEEATWFMMYETASEGTPISPAFETPEELARWLTDTGASAFGKSTASYEAWLRVCNGGYAPSIVVTNGVILNGVEALS